MNFAHKHSVLPTWENVMQFLNLDFLEVKVVRFALLKAKGTNHHAETSVCVIVRNNSKMFVYTKANFIY